MTPQITLTTDRLTLRPPILEDFAATAAFMASPRAQFVGGPVRDTFDQWRGFLSVFGHWAVRGYGFFTVLHDGTPIGRVGLVYHIMWDEPELGWHLFDGHEGQGFAIEAALAVRDWAITDLGLPPMISYVHPHNTRSRSVAQRMGAQFESETTLLGHPAEVWRHKGTSA